MSETAKADNWNLTAAPVWDETLVRLFSPLVADLELDGTALVAECRTGQITRGVAGALTGVKRLMSVEPDRDLLDAARAASAASVPVFYQQQSVRSLSFANDVFSCAVAGCPSGSAADMLNALAELARVTRAGGHVVFAYALSGSLAHVAELAGESAWATGDEWIPLLDQATERAPSVDTILEHVERMGLTVLKSGVESVELAAPSGRALWEHPLVASYVTSLWGAVGESPSASDEFQQDLGRRLCTYYEDPLRSQVLVGWLIARVEAPDTWTVDADDVVESHRLVSGEYLLPRVVRDETTMNVDMADILVGYHSRRDEP
jgi:SAM-dependent methyltransferase